MSDEPIQYLITWKTNRPASWMGTSRTVEGELKLSTDTPITDFDQLELVRWKIREVNPGEGTPMITNIIRLPV